jgi:hypothetical protein
MSYVVPPTHYGAETGPVGEQRYYDVCQPGGSCVVRQALPTTGLPSSVYEDMYVAHDIHRNSSRSAESGYTAAVYHDIEGLTSSAGLVDLTNELPPDWTRRTAHIRSDWNQTESRATNTVSLVIPRNHTVVTFANTHDTGTDWLKPFADGALGRAGQMLEFESDEGPIPEVQAFQTYWEYLPNPKEIAAVQVSTIAQERSSAMERGLKRVTDRTKRLINRFSGKASVP